MAFSLRIPAPACRPQYMVKAAESARKELAHRIKPNSESSPDKFGVPEAKAEVSADTPKSIDNFVISKLRVGSANKVSDGQHGFNDIIDNYAGDAAKFGISFEDRLLI